MNAIVNWYRYIYYPIYLLFTNIYNAPYHELIINIMIKYNVEKTISLKYSITSYRFEIKINYLHNIKTNYINSKFNINPFR